MSQQDFPIGQLNTGKARGFPLPPRSNAGPSHVLATFQNGPIFLFVGVVRHRNLEFEA